MNIPVPFADIILLIVHIGDTESYPCYPGVINTLVKNIMEAYSGNIINLRNDLINLFANKSDRSIQTIMKRFPDEYQILKKVFGSAIWGE